MPRFRCRLPLASIALLAGSLSFPAFAENRAQPSIEFTRVPPASPGSPVRIDFIEGRVKGAQPGQRIVLYAQSGQWWVQPLASRPFTEIQPDSRWKGMTHPGTAYAALLVDSRYVPPPKVTELPAKGGSVLAVATVNGSPAPPPSQNTIQFSGYPWRVRDAGRQEAGQINFYDPANAWTDRNGFLHLRITRRQDQWMCAEVTIPRSLGYGSYRFVIRDVSHLEPAAVLTVGPAAKLAIELSRWGRPEDKNAQYVLVPYSIPANTARFMAPPGTLTHWIDWQPGQVKFRTVRGSSSKAGGDAVAEHAFTSGVQPPGSEGVSFNLFFFDNPRYPLKHEFEVIVEKFEFLP